jgi:hypothetical protein
MSGRYAMQVFEYKVVPAPRRGTKARGARSVPERFAVALAEAMNDLARDGWEYLRADTLPCEERVGLTGTATHFQNMLVFRRAMVPSVTAHPVPAPTAPPAPLPAVVEEDEPTVLVALPSRVAEGAAPVLGPAVGQRPNGRY